jgi:hypothetical protein
MAPLSLLRLECALQFKTKPKLEFAGGFVRECNGYDSINRSSPFVQDVDHPVDQFGRFPGTSRRLNDDISVESGLDQFTLSVIEELAHGHWVLALQPQCYAAMGLNRAAFREPSGIQATF